MGTGIGNRRVLFEVEILDPTDESRFAHGVLPAPQPGPASALPRGAALPSRRPSGRTSHPRGAASGGHESAR